MAEVALAAELQESKRRADELQALLDAERRRAAEAETKLKERERLLKEAQRKPVDKELADKQRAVLSQVRAYACMRACVRWRRQRHAGYGCGARRLLTPHACRRAGPSGAQAALAAILQRRDRRRRRRPRCGARTRLHALTSIGRQSGARTCVALPALRDDKSCRAALRS